MRKNYGIELILIKIQPRDGDKAEDKISVIACFAVRQMRQEIYGKNKINNRYVHMIIIWTKMKELNK